jgi:outer membrane lipoprotein-sorting protein
MNDHDDPQAADLLDRAAEALDKAPTPEGPSPQLVASTVEALEAADNAPDAVRPKGRRNLMLRIARYTVPIAAAAALIVFVVATFFVTPDGGAAFAAVIQNVEKAQSVRFQMTQKLGGGRAFSGRYYVQGDKIRVEIAGMMIMIADMQKKQAVQLNPMQRIANRWKIGDKAARHFGRAFANPVEHFRKLKGEDAEKVGERIVAKRKVDVYRLKKFDLLGMKADATKSNDAQLTVLVDQKSGLPMRIMLEASAHIEGKSDDWFILDEFAWDPPLRADLFSLKIPEGYKVIEGPVGPSAKPKPKPKRPSGP